MILCINFQNLLFTSLYIAFKVFWQLYYFIMKHSSEQLQAFDVQFLLFYSLFLIQIGQCDGDPETIMCLCMFLLFCIQSQQLWPWPDGQFTKPHFFLGKLEQAATQYFVHIPLLVTDNSSRMIQWKGG